MRPVMGGTSRAQPYLWVGIICACKGGRGGMSAHICAHMCVYMAYRVPGTRVDEGSWGGVFVCQPQLRACARTC